MKEIELYLKKHGFGHFSPKAVLFDMDGVIYDSMPNHAVTWHQAMDELGINMLPEEAYAFEGMRGVETVRLLARRQWGRELSDDDAARMYAHKSALFAERSKIYPAQLMPGIIELLTQIRDCGLTICIVTGSAQHTLLDRLNTDLAGLVSPELIITANDVKHGKPAPEPYLCGMQRCGTQPWQTIVVENAPLGVQAATAARCLTIAANTGPLPDEQLRQSGADLIFPSITALSNEWPTILQ